MKGYVTNIPADVMDPDEVIGSYHDLCPWSGRSGCPIPPTRPADVPAQGASRSKGTSPSCSPRSPSRATYSSAPGQTTPQTVTASLGSDVLFGADSAKLQSSATPVLNELKGLAAQYTGKIIITGYVNPVVPGTNSPGDRGLSKQRAAAVASWLVSHNVAEIRITTVGKGTADAV